MIPVFSISGELAVQLAVLCCKIGMGKLSQHPGHIGETTLILAGKAGKTLTIRKRDIIMKVN